MSPMVLVTAGLLSPLATVAGACPIERATYADRDGVARVEFTHGSSAATVSNSFKMLLDNNMTLDGIVQWTEPVARPNGKLMYQCPDGDVTGPELAHCTVWEGVIYSTDDTGKVDLLPAEGIEAPKTLVFSDLAYALRESSAYGVNGFSAMPWDVFEYRGCQ